MIRRIGTIFVIGALALLFVAACSNAGAASSPEETGSIKGRLYLDLNNTSAFDGVDAPLSHTYVRTSHGGVQTDENGWYELEGLPPGSYTLRVSSFPCVDFLWNDWATGEYVLGFCPIGTRPSVQVEVMAGTATAADLVANLSDGRVDGRVWLDGTQAPNGTAVSLYVDDELCRSTTTSLAIEGLGPTVARFTVFLPTDGGPDCEGDTVSVKVRGLTLESWTWDLFWLKEWRESQYAAGYIGLVEVADPPVLGVSGEVEGGLGGDVRAIISGRLCSVARQPRNGDFYGLVVWSASVQFGCGEAGAEVIFCVDGDLADETREWTEYLGRFVRLNPSGERCPPLRIADGDCDGDTDAVDGLAILRLVAHLEPITDCWNPGDVDCDGDRDAVDGLIVLKHEAGLPFVLPPGCHSFVLN